MQRRKTVCCKLYLGASFTTACLKRTPDRFLALASVYVQRRIIHSLSQHQDSDPFFYADKCLRKNPISEDKLSDYCLEKTKDLQKLSSDNLLQSIQTSLTELDTNICNMVTLT